ncbi:inositol monophosphatase [Candidatus Thioglobus sp.]|uniref:inositol monophosphatase family protein n=1 Tax=Candidatus Thioglobus sp. TaxID=2026721 RepID=UPI002628168E|nr:inositol monophosphatase [Candidatus Thioglobus sp.]MDG2394842.1 inositol monophosphatase [Candidatus Thioglobus sp.]
MTIDIQHLISIVKKTAKEELLPRFQHVAKQYKLDGSIVTEADIAAQKRIQESLYNLYPEITLLGEEMSAEEQLNALSNHNGVWVLDPIDGTSNFSHGLPYYCVSLALIQNQEVQLGIVYDPERDECFYAQKDQGAFLNNKKLNAPDYSTSLNQAIVGVDLKRLPVKIAAELASNPPYASQRSLGSIALDWCWVSTGRIQAYLHGKHNLWDYAACWLILEEANGASKTINGDCVFTPTMEHKFAMAAVSTDLLNEWFSIINEKSI